MSEIWKKWFQTLSTDSSKTNLNSEFSDKKETLNLYIKKFTKTNKDKELIIKIVDCSTNWIENKMYLMSEIEEKWIRFILSLWMSFDDFHRFVGELKKLIYQKCDKQKRDN